MEQIRNIKEVKQDLIYPIYKEQNVNNDITHTLEYDVDSIIHKNENEMTIIYTLGKYQFQKIIFVGLGSKENITTKKIRKAISTVSSTLKENAVIYLDEIVTEEIDIHKVTQLTIESHLISSYKQRKIGHDTKDILNLDILVSNENVENDIQQGIIYGEGINYARTLADAPANIVTPGTLVKEAQKLAEKYGMECTILDKEKLEEMGAGGILAVNQGSDLPPYMICLKYINSDTPYSAIVGKGITFDSGGYNLKGNSFGMKYDMCGAADVLGVMKIIAESQIKTNVYGIIPTTENLVNGKAYKPQDVVTTLSKKTVEIVNTDAEGRMILCDALTYAQNLGATSIIDLATLTGACVTALGNIYTGVFSNSDSYYQQFEKALKESDERGWRLPVDKEYLDILKSDSADIANSKPGTGGGASQAASFLGSFINEGVQWIHLDIAGTSDSGHSGATGAMIRSIVTLLKNS